MLFLPDEALSSPSILKDYSVQHLSDTSIMVESILIQVTVQSEDPATKLLLVSWTYQVRCGCGLCHQGRRQRFSQGEFEPL